MSELETNRKEKQNIIEEAVISMISAESRSRLSNIKSVALERYYKIEQILYELYTKSHVQQITDEEFIRIIQTTEKPKKTFVYTKRSDLFDDLE